MVLNVVGGGRVVCWDDVDEGCVGVEVTYC